MENRDDGERLIKWVLIIRFPGLDEIYPVKVTRSMPLTQILTQFGSHVLCCTRCTDKVIYAIKNRILGHDANYDILLATIKRYLENPNAFVLKKGMNFEDYIIIEYYKYAINKIFVKRNVKKQAIDKLTNARKRRIDEESYLNITFAEDFRRTHGELLIILTNLKVQSIKK